MVQRGTGASWRGSRALTAGHRPPIVNRSSIALANSAAELVQSWSHREWALLQASTEACAQVMQSPPLAVSLEAAAVTFLSGERSRIPREGATSSWWRQQNMTSARTLEDIAAPQCQWLQVLSGPRRSV